jgi:hypothetical protein
MLRIDRLAFAFGFLLTGAAARAQEPGPSGDAMRVEAGEFPTELRWKLGAWALRASLRVGGVDLGLKPPPRSQMWLRIRTAAERDWQDPVGLIYTQGTAALTLYAATPTDVLDGTGTFDPILSLLDGVVETAWFGRIQKPWEIPNALRLGLDRHFAQPLLDVLQDEEKKDATLPRWPGVAKARKGSLENLPADHPLVQDRDHVLDVLARFEAKFGRARIAQHLLDCNQGVLSSAQVTVATEKLLEPITAELGKPLLPVATFETRVPWKGEGAEPPDSRLNGLASEVPYLDDYQLRVCFGEQRASARTFQPWAAGGAPTLFFRIPLTGTWTISGVEVLARRLVEEGKPDLSAQRHLWAVVLDEHFRELYRWPFPQSAVPKDKAAWVKLPFSASPSLPADYWFVAIEAEDPGPGNQIEICVRPDAVAEHSFRSVPGHRVTKLDAPVEFAIYADIKGRAIERGKAPRAILEDLKALGVAEAARQVLLKKKAEQAPKKEPAKEPAKDPPKDPAKKDSPPAAAMQVPPEFQEQLAADGIELDREKREVRVKGAILRLRQSPDYPIEYALVTNEGAKHEAFGMVRCTPSLLNACFLALGLEPGSPRHRIEREPMPKPEDLEAGLEVPFTTVAPTGPRVFIYVRWTEGGKTTIRPFEDLFVDLRDGKPLPMRGYVYLGSRFVEIEEGGAKKRVFLADYEGNLIAVHPDVARDAAANRAVSDCLFDAYTLDDEPYAWADVDEGKLPAERVPVEFVFALDARADCRPFEPEVIAPPIELPSARALAQKTRNPAWDGTREEWLDRIGARPLQELAAIVRHSRQPLREAALVLLGASGRDEAVETLSLALRFDRSSEARLAAAYALAEVGSTKAVDALIDALEVPAPPIVDDAVCGLRLLSGEDLGRRPLPWREWARTRPTPPAPPR